MDNEFILFDRIEVLRLEINKYGEENFVLSFSGGKDSTVLHYLLDLALPGNKVTRVFINTGIEYDEIVEFVQGLAEKDKRIKIIKPTYPLGKVLKEYGYPFKSKEHSKYLNVFQNMGMESKTVQRYLHPSEERKRYGCPKILRYQFSDDFNLKVSNECCNKLKKEPFANWQKENNIPIKLTGERASEGGLRAIHGDCLVVDKKGNLKKFKPLNKVTSEWMEWFIEDQGIQLCKLYYAPYNFKRTGCRSCPYNVKIKDDLQTLYDLMPSQYRKSVMLWKPVYDEYIRIGYRLKQYPHDTKEKER